jgi:hypothetical protein
VSGILNLLYVFLAALVALPIVELLLLEARRARALRAFGAARGRHALAIVEREETVALLGLPLFRYATVPSAGEVARSLQRVPAGAPLDVLVHLPYDAPLDVDEVAHALAARPGPVTLIVPACALTGGLSLIRSADEVLCGEHASFAQEAEEAVGARELGGALRRMSESSPAADSRAPAAHTRGPAASAPPTRASLPDGLGHVLDLFARPVPDGGGRRAYLVGFRR